jgi:hypothetical protein
MLSILRTSPWGFGTESDSAFNFQLSSDIQQRGRFALGVGFERIADYSFNPALNLWSTALSDISGLGLYPLAALLFPVLSCLILLLFHYLSVRLLLGKIAAPWACLVLTCIPTFIVFEASYSKEPFSLMFFVMCLYFVFQSLKGRNTSAHVALGFLATFMVVFAHQWTAYNLMVTIAVLWILPIILVRLLRNFHRIIPDLKAFLGPMFCLSVFVVVFSWFIFAELPLFAGQILLSSTFFKPLISEHVSHGMPFLSANEKIMVYSGYAFLAAIGLEELLVGSFRKSKDSSELVVEAWSVFGAVYLIVFTFFLPRGYNFATISQRGWIFAFLGAAPLVAKGITRVSGKCFSRKWISRLSRNFPLILIFPLVSAILLCPPYIINPTQKDPDQSFYATATWMRQYASNATVAMDFYTWNVLVPHGRVNYYPESSPYTLDPSSFVSYAYSKENFNLFNNRWKMFAFNKDISQWFNATADSSAFDGYYNKIHDSQSLSIYTNP